MKIQKIPVNIKIPENLLQAIDHIAARRGTSRTQFILDPVREKLNLLGFRINGEGEYYLKPPPKPYRKKRYRHYD